MPRGGSRKHPKDCKCGNCPKMGRPKASRPTNAPVAQMVLARKHSQELWETLIDIECERLGIDPNTGRRIPPPKPKKKKKGQLEIEGPDYPGNFSIIPLVNLLRYLEDRAHGRCTENVNHMHDKPVDLNVKLSLGEGMRLAMQKAEERVRSRSRSG